MSSLKAARADNYYVPRGWDPSMGSRNQFSKARALRSHNKKYKNGVPCIRFEVPFHIRCEKCDNMIAKGVRFNSEKRTVGQFLSTKILEFTMYCPHCSNPIKCKTDPENCDYNFTLGARRILNTEHATDMQFIEDPEEKKKKILNPIYRLEGKVVDERKAEDMKPKIDQIKSIQDRMKDDFDLNLMMRKKFKQEKAVLQEKERKANEVKNFALELEDLTPKEMMQVKKVKFSSSDAARNLLGKRKQIMSQNVLGGSHALELLQQKIKMLPKGTREQLKAELKHNQIVKQQERQFVQFGSNF